MSGRLEDVILRGTRAAQPLATAVGPGTLYFVTGENVLERSSGSAWQSYSGAGTPSSGAGIGSPIPFFTEPEEPNEPIIIFPTPAQIRAILAGTNITFDDTVPGFRTISAAGSSAGWTLIQTQAAPAGPTLDFVTSIGSYSELLCAWVLVGTTQNSSINVQVSVDGGGSWLTASGDYKIVANADGTETNDTDITASGGLTTAVRSGYLNMVNTNGTTNPKFARQLVTAGIGYRIPTTSAINGIRFKTVNVGTTNFNGGNFYVFGKI